MFILDHTQEIWSHFDFLNIEGFLYSKRKQSGVVLIKPITLLDPKQRQNIVNIWYLLYCHTVLTYFTSMWLDFRICECKWEESYVLLGKKMYFWSMSPETAVTKTLRIHQSIYNMKMRIFVERSKTIVRRWNNTAEETWFQRKAAATVSQI